uniref:J domain-containing protein n=1 Tax=viral metagenome TaxID=1070528 RepID=A0A6C0JST8_9ZZZZ
MSVLKTDHYKEYFYKMSANGAKLFYKRTASGHKKIAKNEIPTHLVDSILEYDEKKDPDWMKYVYGVQKEIDELTEKLRLLPTWNIPEATKEKSRKIFEDRISYRERSLVQYKKYNEEAAEERYREETDKYGGFNGYFKAKYKNYKNFNCKTPKFTTDDNFNGENSTSEQKTPPKEDDEYKPSPSYHKTDFSTLIELGIITSCNTPKEEAKKKYRRYLVANHPDKGGDPEICKLVISQYEDFCAQ